VDKKLEDFMENMKETSPYDPRKKLKAATG